MKTWMDYIRRGLLVCFMIFVLTEGQLLAEVSYHFRYLTIDQGLPQNTVHSILKDIKGFMWFATGNGLSRYDGYSFTNFRKPDLPSNLVNALTESPNGRIWVGTSHGLVYFEQSTGRLTLFDLPCKEGFSINITRLMCDKKGRVWVGTTENGLFLLTPSENNYTVQHINQSNSVIPGNNVSAFLQMRDGRILIGTNHGIAVYDNQRDNIYLFNQDSLSEAFVLSLFESMEGDLWVGTYNGVWIFNALTGRNEWHFYNPFNPRSISHSRINHITQDFKGTIYLGSLGGVDLYQPQSNSFLSLPYKKVNEFSLNSIFVNCIYIDNEGNVWIGTEKGGVNQFSLYQKPFHYMIHQIDNTNSLSNSTVNAILSDGDILWVGTAGGGLNRYNRKTGIYTHYKHDPLKSSSIPGDYITSLLKTPDGALWVGTWGTGLCKMKEDGTFQTFLPPVPNAETNFVNAFVSSLQYVNPGYLFIGTEGGLAILNIKTGKFIEIENYENALAGLNEIGCILMDRQGYIWIGTRNGLYNFPYNDLELSKGKAVCLRDHLVVFKEGDGDQPSLPGNYIISLLQDNEGNIWIGTYGDGLVKFTTSDGKTGSFEFYSSKNGLSNNVIYSIQQDEAGNIWVSTDYGLARINPQSGSIDNFFSDDGLVSDQFYWSASFKSSTGELFFGSIDGISYFSPTNFPLYPFEPSITISALKVFNEIIQVGEKRFGKVVLNRPVSDVEEISLSYKDNVFTLDFTALDYFHPRKIKYAYQLEGVDPGWVEVGSDQRSATYTNLKGGSYIFKVKATNSEGVYSDNEKRLVITIRPPFWETTWFLILLIIAIIVTTAFYIRHHTKRLILEKSRLEKMVSERTRKIEEQNEQMRAQSEELKLMNADLIKRGELIEGQKKELEDKNSEIIQQRDQLVELNKEIESINQTRLRFFTNISHEFRTPLTLIISPVERMLKEMHLPGMAHELLNSVQRNARRLSLLIDQLLMFRKIETGNLTVRVAQGDFKTFVTDIFHAFDVLAQQRSIAYSLKISLDETPRWFDAEKTENILYNLLSNAFKYTPSGGSVAVMVDEQKLMKQGNEIPSLCIKVADTGIGIDDTQADKIFNRFYRTANGSAIKGTGIGLSLTRELVEALHGTIAFSKNRLQGSCFTATIPCRREDFHGAEINDFPAFDTSELDNKVQVVLDHLAGDEPFLTEEHQSNNEDPLVLIVEDNKELALFISNTLSGSYRVLTAPNGKVGYELARKQSPDIIISDVMMPVMDGIEMCRQIKNNLYTSHIPVILLSAKALIEDQLAGFQTGADDYISKPFNLDLLRAKVQNIIDGRRKMRALFASKDELITVGAKLESLDDKFLAKAYDVLEKAYANPEFSVELFSDQMFVSRSLLYKKLKALVDLSPNDFITVYRLKKSLPLLASKEMTVNEVAYSIGFNDPKYFSRVFKKFYKKKPSEYIQ